MSISPMPRNRTAAPSAMVKDEKGDEMKDWVGWLAYAIGGLYCVMPWASPFLALAIGTFLALTFCNPVPRLTRSLSVIILQISVVLLGFAIDPVEISRSVAGGVIFAAFSLISTFFLGLVIGRFLGIRWRQTALISAGTAICGGSAISTIGTRLGADEETMNVAVGTIFVLNTAALYSFPFFGHALQLDQDSFGVWVGVAVHDISSVVGAAETYGSTALQTATVVKLSRVLWILPLAWCVRWITRRWTPTSSASSIPSASAWPWTIGAFALAMCIRWFVPQAVVIAPVCYKVAISGFMLALFFVGACITRSTLRVVGWRSLVQGIILWAFVSLTSLLLIMINREH